VSGIVIWGIWKSQIPMSIVESYRAANRNDEDTLVGACAYFIGIIG
jgi:hypothetical protein